MPSLLSLPAEIHLQIIEETDIYDLEALWTSCKTFYLYGAKDLRANHRRKALYHTIVVGRGNDSRSQTHPLLDLRDLLEDEDARFYPRVMKINSLSYWDLGNERYHMKKAGIVGIIIKHGDRITKLVSEVHRKLFANAPTWNAMAMNAIAWNKDIQNGRPAATVLLLLALYPHLESLHIYTTGQNWWDEKYWTLFSALTTAAMDPVTNTLGIYSRLSELSLFGKMGGFLRDEESETELFNPFMALPTMRSLEARDLEVRFEPRPRARRGLSQVNDVKFISCDVDMPTLSHQIQAVKTLKRFTYTFYPSKELWASWEKPRLQPGAILALLRKYACDTLTFLELAACSLENSVPFEHDDPYIGSLCMFKALQVVKLDTMMLYERTTPSAHVALNLWGKFPRDHRFFSKPQKLIDFLPPSIQSFQITSTKVGKGLWKKEVDTMFKDFPQLRTERLPDLKEICIEYKENGNTMEEEGRRELYSRCKEAGTTIARITVGRGDVQRIRHIF
ncbi:hypothetical protein BDR22DRAFT_819904 [Usnea florida]